MKKQLEWILFAALSAVAIVSFYYQHRVLNLLMLASSIFYLVLGWKLFNPEDKRKFDPVYFILGYAVSEAFMAFFLNASNYPLGDLLLYGSIFFLLLSLVLILVFKKIKRSEAILRILVFLILIVLAMIV